MKDIKFEGLRICGNVVYHLDKHAVDYLGETCVRLIVQPDGKAYIQAGRGSNNVHGLQGRDLHKGAYPTPYFAYKNTTLWNSVEDAMAQYNKWRGRR